MSIQKDRIEYSKKLKIQAVVRVMSYQEKLSPEETLRRFMSSKTYDLLADNQSRLWSESEEYILDMLMSELNGDVAEWLKI